MDIQRQCTRVLIVCDDNTLLYPLSEFLEVADSLPEYEISIVRISHQGNSNRRRWWIKAFANLDGWRIRDRERTASSKLNSRVKRLPVQTFLANNPQFLELRSQSDILIVFGDFPELTTKHSALAQCYFVAWDSHPTGFWEVSNQQPLSRAHLCLREGGENGSVLSVFSVQTRTHEVSPIVNQARMERSAWGLVTLLLRDREVLLKRRDFVTPTNRPVVTARLSIRPRDLVALVWRALAAAVLTRVSGRARRVEWSIGVLRDSVDPTRSVVAANARWMTPPSGSFIADPFPCQQNGSRYLFVEQYLYGKRKGVISVCSLSNGVPQNDLHIVLDEPFHLSYPFVFEHGGKYYLLPERSTTGKVVLYEAEQFPDRWRECVTLLSDFPGVDPTLLFFNERWWLFCSMGGLSMQDSNLHLFFSTNLTGPFSPHPLNPIVLDISCARMAGRIIEKDGSLYRPAQDCTMRYGSRVIFMKLESLTETDYREHRVGLIEADGSSPFGEALHTIQLDGDYTLITGMRYA